MLNFVLVRDGLPNDKELVLVKAKKIGFCLGKLFYDSEGTPYWDIQPYKDVIYTCGTDFIILWAYLDEQHNAPIQLTEDDVRRIVREELDKGNRKADKYRIISIRPVTDGKYHWAFFDISIYAEVTKTFIRHQDGTWVGDRDYLLDKYDSDELERTYRKLMGFYV